MAELVPRWEWRTFGETFGPAEEAFATLTAERVEESDEVYLLSAESDASVKVRDGLMDVKHLEAVDGDGLEQWVPVLKGAFPLPASDVAVVLAALRVAARPLDRAAYGFDDLLDEVVRPNGLCWPPTCTSGGPATPSAAAWPSSARCGRTGALRARSRSSRRIPPWWSPPCARSASPPGRTSAWPAA